LNTHRVIKKQKSRINITKIFRVKLKPIYGTYRVCHGFRLTKRVAYFWVDFDHF